MKRMTFVFFALVSLSSYSAEVLSVYKIVGYKNNLTGAKELIGQSGKVGVSWCEGNYFSLTHQSGEAMPVRIDKESCQNIDSALFQVSDDGPLEIVVVERGDHAVFKEARRIKH